MIPVAAPLRGKVPRRARFFNAEPLSNRRGPWFMMGDLFRSQNAKNRGVVGARDRLGPVGGHSSSAASRRRRSPGSSKWRSSKTTCSCSEAGGGGNTAVFITANGVVVVDTKNPGWGQPMLDKIKELTDKPVTMIINTHTHGDHVSGNVEFPATVDVVAQENTKANMKQMRRPMDRRAEAAATSSSRTTGGGCRSGPSRTG